MNNNELPSSTDAETRSSPTQWKRSFTAYRAPELRALKFSSVEGINRAIELCWEDPDLKGVPRHSPDGITMIVPEEAVELFRAKEKEFAFEVSRVLSRKDIPLERLAEMRRRYGM